MPCRENLSVEFIERVSSGREEKERDIEAAQKRTAEGETSLGREDPGTSGGPEREGKRNCYREEKVAERWRKHSEPNHGIKIKGKRG